MRLYLSSYRIGDHEDRLLDLLRGRRRACIIANALDSFSIESIREHWKKNYDPLEHMGDVLGQKPDLLDLRNFFDEVDTLRAKLESYDLTWVIGGNCFILLYAMIRSGFKEAIQDMLHRDAIVYGGFSAGACVAAPTLKGIDLMDEPETVHKLYSSDPIYEAMNLVDFSIVPHYQSDHPESEMANNSVAFLQEEGLPYQTLQDGDVVVKEGKRIEVLKKR